MTLYEQVKEHDVEIYCIAYSCMLGGVAYIAAGPIAGIGVGGGFSVISLRAVQKGKEENLEDKME